MAGERGLGAAARYGHAMVQSVLRLFAAGAVIFEAHNLFLRYYANEWRGVQISGVNGCAGEEMIANGDLFNGQTLCNKPENFVPWTVIYQHHWQAALAYYGAIAAVLIVLGWIWITVQRRLASSTPFGGAPKTVSPADSEHLR